MANKLYERKQSFVNNSWLTNEQIAIYKEHRINKKVTFNKAYACFICLLLSFLFIPDLVIANPNKGFTQKEWYCKCGYLNGSRADYCGICGKSRWESKR